MSGAHRDARCGKGLATDELRSVGEETFEDGGAEARPDEARGDVLVRGVELVQVRVGLPVLEQEGRFEPTLSYDRERLPRPGLARARCSHGPPSVEREAREAPEAVWW